ncbi:MAG: Ig-like domain-containing protein, partial [bacterium]
DLTGNGNDGTLTNSGSGYWDADVYGNNDICLGSGACVDSVIAALPFFHAATLDETMGDDWNFQNYPHGVDYTYELTLSTQRSLYIDTCDTLTNFDTLLSIKDECGNPISLTEFDDGDSLFCPEASVDPPHFASIIDSINLEAGTYYIVLDGWSGALGDYAIAVGTLPEILSSTIAVDDSYLEIRFSEGMYTEATGNGALETSDFEISFNQNGGTATGVDIDYMSNTSGSALEGGEDTVRFAIAVQGESTGLERVMIRTQSNASIFNSFGIGLLRSASITQNLSDQIVPFLVSSNPDDGAINIATYSDITIEFSEPIQNADGTDISNSNSENSILLKNSNTGDSLSYAITTSNNTNFNIFPDDDLPEYSYIQIILLSNIEDTNGNLFGNDTI